MHVERVASDEQKEGKEERGNKHTRLNLDSSITFGLRRGVASV